MNWQDIGTAMAAISALATGAWAWWLKNKKSVAETNAQVAVSDAQEAVYKLVTDRLTRLEQEVTEVRAELAEERKHSRALELKLASLEAWIRSQGLTPPAL